MVHSEMDAMQKLVCPADSSLVESSSGIKVIPHKKYIVSTQVIGNKGCSYSAYFGVAFFDKVDEVIRSNDGWKDGKGDFSHYYEEKIRWLNDFSGTRRSFSIVFLCPERCSTAKISYRINDGTPVKSDCEYLVVPLDKITIIEADSSLDDDYENPWKFVLPRAQELTAQQEMTLEKNIVWLFGSRRSGTSWLGNQLLSVNTVYFHEPNITPHLAPEGNFGLGRVERLVDYTKRFAWTDYFFSDNYKATWQYYLKKLILYRIYAKTRDFNQKVIIKEPSSGEGASDILSTCTPLSKIIIMLRDGRDIINSHLDARQKGGWLVTGPSSVIEGERARLRFIEYQANIWVKQMKLLMKTFEFHSKDLRLIIKYEDLRARTFEVLHRVYNFLDIEVSDEKLKRLVTKYSYENIPEDWKGNGKFIGNASPGKWKNTFDENEKEIMRNIMADTLLQLGYQD
jgi:hypothetical protein